MRIRVATPVTVIGRGDKKYGLRVEEWQLIPYLRWRIYHWYDMIVPIKFPGFKKLQLARKTPEFVNEWLTNQDLKCFHLSTNCLQLTYLDIDEETFKKLDRGP